MVGCLVCRWAAPRSWFLAVASGRIFCQKLNWKGEMEHANKRPHDPQIPKPLNAPQDGHHQVGKPFSETNLAGFNFHSKFGRLWGGSCWKAGSRSCCELNPGDYGKKSSLKVLSLLCAEGSSFDYGQAGMQLAMCKLCATPHCSFPPSLTNPDHRVVACLVHPSAFGATSVWQLTLQHDIHRISSS